MFFISIWEIVSLAIITVVLGYIFMDYITPVRAHDPFSTRQFNWDDLKFASMIIAPAVIVHELFHKFVAIGFGLPATFHVWWMGLGIALILKFMKSPIIFLAPAFVAYPAIATSSQNMLIAFAGPFANLAMFLGAFLWLKYRRVSRRQAIILVLTKKINLFLFVFNMIPLQPFDGYYVIQGLVGLF